MLGQAIPSAFGRFRAAETMILAIVRKNNYMSHYAYIIESFGLGQARLDCLFLAGFHTILADSKEMVGI